MTVEVLQPDPSKAHMMSYAPGIFVAGGTGLLFISGCTASPLYHKHPHDLAEHHLPIDIESQTRLAMENVKLVLDMYGLTFRDVVKVTKYLTDARDGDTMVPVMNEYFGDWKPASTMITVTALSVQGARIELEMLAIVNKK